MQPDKVIEFPTKGLRLEYYEGMILLRSEDEMRILSSAVRNGGLTRAHSILNMTVRWMYYSLAPEEEIKRYEELLGLPGIVGMMTAADVRKAAIGHEDGITVVVTAGASNAATPGEEVRIWKGGTVNILVVLESDMTDEALANSFITITEAKALAFNVLDIRSVNSGNAATGTTTDSIAVASLGRGDALRYASAGTDAGRIMGKLVFRCVLENILKNNGVDFKRPFLRRASERMIDTKGHFDTIRERMPKASGISDSVLELYNEGSVHCLFISGLKMLDEFQNQKEGDLESLLTSMQCLGRCISERIGGAGAAMEYASVIDGGLFEDVFVKEPAFALSLGLFVGILSGGA